MGYLFFIEFIFIVAPMVFSIMSLSYGLLKNNFKISLHNLISDGLIATAFICFFIYYFKVKQIEFIFIVGMITIVMKISTHMRVIGILRSVILGTTVLFIIQFLVSGLMIFLLGIDFHILQSGGFYSIIGTTVSSIIAISLGMKLYLVKNKERRYKDETSI